MVSELQRGIAGVFVEQQHSTVPWDQSNKWYQDHQLTYGVKTLVSTSTAVDTIQLEPQYVRTHQTDLSSSATPQMELESVQETVFLITDYSITSATKTNVFCWFHFGQVYALVW